MQWRDISFWYPSTNRQRHSDLQELQHLQTTQKEHFWAHSSVKKDQKRLEGPLQQQQLKVKGKICPYPANTNFIMDNQFPSQLPLPRFCLQPIYFDANSFILLNPYFIPVFPHVVLIYRTQRSPQASGSLKAWLEDFEAKDSDRAFKTWQEGK